MPNAQWYNAVQASRILIFFQKYVLKNFVVTKISRTFALANKESQNMSTLSSVGRATDS